MVSKVKTVIVTGGTGSVGKVLVPMLIERDFNVIIFTRSEKRESLHPNCTYVSWDPAVSGFDTESIQKADAIINLAGAGIADKRWTKKRKNEILQSRVDSAETIVKAIQKTDNKVQTIISASAVGYYGTDDTGRIFSEEDPPGDDFLAGVCTAWEQSIRPVDSLNKRLVILRTGIVLDSQSGMHKELSMPLKFRVAAIPGTGLQMMSWIHIDDLCRMYVYALENDRVAGTYNACAPAPVTLRKIITGMGEQRYGNRFLRLRIPPILLQLALGQMADDALLKGSIVSSDKILAASFSFNFPEINTALKNLHTSD